MIHITAHINTKPVREGRYLVTRSRLSTTLRVDLIHRMATGYMARLTHPKEDAPYDSDLLTGHDPTWVFFHKNKNKLAKIPVLNVGDTYAV